jgi:ketosteroid isomerase-like protein
LKATTLCAATCSATEVMSNADLVRAAYDCEFNRDRPGSLDAAILAFLAPLDPQVVFESDAGEPNPRVIRGQDGVREALECAPETWDAFRYEVSDVEELDPGRVMAWGRIHARPRASAERIELRFANIWTLRGGKAIRIQAYGDRATALAALESRGAA